MSNTTPTDDLPIVCDPSGITAEQSKRWLEEIVPQVYKAVQEIRELPDGYAWRLPGETNILMLLAEDLSIERLCCPFLRYTLEIEPGRGDFWLSMTGGEGAKDFLRITYEGFNLFDAEVARAAGLNVSDGKNLDTVEAVFQAVDTINTQFAQSHQS
ncbi:MAG: hypothetical protein K8I30_22665 [Anaerolineae bacterium]|nr:hypothetical protein [Anaerolineae bacterium]